MARSTNTSDRESSEGYQRIKKENNGRQPKACKFVALRSNSRPTRGIGGILSSWLNHPVHDSFRHSARIVGKALLPPAQSRWIPRLDQHSGKASPLKVYTCPAIHTVWETKRRTFATRCPLPWWRWLIEQFPLARKIYLTSSCAFYPSNEIT